MLDLAYPIAGLRGADYNPRRIDEADLAALRESVARLGVVKPIIVRGDLIVAGHQRTKALRANGAATAPVYVLPQETTVYDEVRFNQLHNGTDLDAGDEALRVVGGFSAGGWHQVEAVRFEGNRRGRLAVVRREIADLVTKYGPWGGCVATMSGEVIHCAQYALACSALGLPVTTFVVPDERRDEYVAFLGRQYGVFSYDGIKRETYIQTFAQMFRLRRDGEGNKSALYEGRVVPWLAENPAARGLDFGSGQGDYAAALRRRGFDLLDLELFRRSPVRNVIDMRAVNRMIDQLCAALAGAGRFGFVVCDSVLNSVDSPEAEGAVMTMLNALAAPGAPVFFSGRPREAVEADKLRSRRRVEFLDEQGFTALYRAGRWFFQKFHTAEQVAALCERHGLEVVDFARKGDGWQCHARKARDLPREQVAAAIAFEFDLPVGESRRIGRVADVSAALLPHIAA